MKNDFQLNNTNSVFNAIFIIQNIYKFQQTHMYTITNKFAYTERLGCQIVLKKYNESFN